MRGRRRHLRANVLATALGLTAIALAAVPVYSQSFDNINALLDDLRVLDPETLQPLREQLRTQPAACYADSVVREEVVSFWTLLEAVQEEMERQRGLSGSASFGFTGNDVPLGETPTNAGEGEVVQRERSQYKLNLGMDLARGFYPGRFEFSSRVDMRLDGTTFTEDVTNLRISYDYYFRPHVEFYAFANRFSDSFMNVDQRYEAGGGVVFDKFSGGYVESRDQSPAGLDGSVFGHTATDHSLSWSTSAPPSWFECLRALDPQTATSIALGLRTLERVLHDLWTETREAYHQRHAKLRVALLLGGNAELEQSKLKRTTTTKLDLPGSRSGARSETFLETFPIDSQQTWRFILRPTITYRPTGALRLYWLTYVKLAPDQGTVIRVAQDATLRAREVRDIRTETEVGAELTVADAPFGQPGDVKVVAKWEHYFDNAPPTYIRTVAGQLDDGFSAPRKHSIFSLTLDIGWD